MNYETTDQKTDKRQLWHVYTGAIHHPTTQQVLSGYGTEPNLHAVKGALEKVAALTGRDLYAVPLITQDISAGINNRLDYRGNTADGGAFVIRGKRIGEITARASYHYADTPKPPDYVDHCYFKPDDYGVCFTDCQQAELNKRFGAQLWAILNDPDVLKAVQSYQHAEVMATAKRDVNNYRAQLDAIEAFAG